LASLSHVDLKHISAFLMGAEDMEGAQLSVWVAWKMLWHLPALLRAEFLVQYGEHGDGHFLPV